MCGPKGCKVSFRIQNSYGVSWQESHGDGWVDGDWLLKEMMAQSKGPECTAVVMNWIMKPGKNLPAIDSPSPASAPALTPSSPKKGGFSPMTVAGRLYRCVSPEGAVELTDMPHGSNCSPLDQ